MVLTQLAVDGEGCILPLHCTYPIADYAYVARNDDNGDVCRQVPAFSCHNDPLSLDMRVERGFARHAHPFRR